MAIRCELFVRQTALAICTYAYTYISCFSLQKALYACAAKERVEHLLVESNIKNRQREALSEIREILEDVETKPKDAKVRQLARANVFCGPYQVMIEVKFHQGKTLKCTMISRVGREGQW